MANKFVNLVTGGAGFLGSYLIDTLMNNQEEVICLDNFYTGRKENISKWLHHKNFKFLNHDIVNPINLDVDVDRIWHLACPASPVSYQLNPIKTTKISFLGTYNLLGLAKRVKARFLMASTSEVYGDPEVSPQKETYKGNVNPIGIRSCYDEGKRVAESLCFDYNRFHGVDIRVARIFNTYGPRMRANDGRVISNFVVQALKNQPITIYGDGSQTRSFCYVDDLIKGLTALMNSEYMGPVNIGNPNEFTINQLANLVREKINLNLHLKNMPLPSDDPLQRRPDISLAKKKLFWEPKINLDQGLNLTIDYFKENLN